ncbi:MAG: amino acid ABC transporter permease [Oscillospiraceae bacterium]|nr:amino acid ABC transporter permease [Oscillospiraceae bacterium]
MQWFDTVKTDFISSFITGDRWRMFLQGLGVTLRVTFISALLGLALGILLAFMKISKKSNGKRTVFSFIAGIYIDVIRGTPVVVQLMILYFAVLASVNNKMLVGSIAFGMNSGAYVAEIIRSGIQSIDRGQAEAGRSLGLSSRRTMQYIIIPQAFKNVLPTLGNEFIVLMKETAVLGYVGLMDLMKTGSYVVSKTYRAFMPLIGTAVIYFVVIKIFSLLLARLERRLQKNDSR